MYLWYRMWWVDWKRVIFFITLPQNLEIFLGLQRDDPILIDSPYRSKSASIRQGLFRDKIHKYEGKIRRFTRKIIKTRLEAIKYDLKELGDCLLDFMLKAYIEHNQFSFREMECEVTSAIVGVKYNFVIFELEASLEFYLFFLLQIWIVIAKKSWLIYRGFIQIHYRVIQLYQLLWWLYSFY